MSIRWGLKRKKKMKRGRIRRKRTKEGKGRCKE
jgi:hypothetical protein